MKFHSLLAVSGIALSAFLIAPTMAQDNSMPAANGGRVDANGMPTTHSTPAEHAATADLNAQVGVTSQQADATTDQNNAQYQQQQQQYQNQLQQHDSAMQQNNAAVQQYQDQTATYEGLKARYAAERAAYHRGIWPDRYMHWTLEENDGHLIGQRVEIINGDRVGTVTDVAHSPNGHVMALRVALDNDKVVWIDDADVRYDRADGIVMTNLASADLRAMADERM
jgi:multidrug efflux pump subunit AcrA (membrane-fusion protein)